MMLKNNPIYAHDTHLLSPFCQKDYQMGLSKSEGVKIKSYDHVNSLLEDHCTLRVYFRRKRFIRLDMY